MQLNVIVVGGKSALHIILVLCGLSSPVTIRHYAVVVTVGGKNYLLKKSLCLQIILFVLFSFFTTSAKAQWIKKDTLNLNRNLKNEENIYINQREVQNIQFGNSIINKPITRPYQTNILSFDETLPESKKKMVLTLQPYKPTTPYNWDPIFHCKIIQVGNHWEPIISPAHFNDQTRATELMMSVLGRMNNNGRINLGKSGAYIQGTVLGGLDLMILFERKFWDKSGEKRRARTMEVLKQYNDTVKFIKLNSASNKYQSRKNMLQPNQ